MIQYDLFDKKARRQHVRFLLHRENIPVRLIDNDLSLYAGLDRINKKLNYIFKSNKIVPNIY